MDTYFRIITPVYNAEKWIDKNIQSVAKQRYNNYEHIIVDDCSTDKTVEVIKRLQTLYPKVTLITKPKREGVLHSHLLGLFTSQKPPSKDCVVVHLDGDDWLKGVTVLKRLNELYQDPTVWVTYGNYSTTDGSPSVCRKFDPKISPREYIKKGWIFSHLRTFRFSVLESIKRDSFFLKEGPNSRLFPAAADVALFTPILELAGYDRVRYIEDTLCVYNRVNPLNEDKASLQDQILSALTIASYPPYQRK